MPPRLRLLLVAACLWVATGRTQNSTTVPIFLPGYGPGDWEAYRGSIIASDDQATTYTLFCAEQTPPVCVLDADLPLSFAEGPGTLRYDGTKSDQITAHLSCRLAGSTAATCTGSSSYGTGFREGSITGPTQTVWTKTLTGEEVRWGVLTLTTPPANPATTNLDDPDAVDGATATFDVSTPVPTSGSSSFVRSEVWRWSLFIASSIGITAILS